MGILVIALFESKGEGTKQIMPTSGSNGELQLMPSFSQFALFDCPESDRLYIHIKTVGEKICFGFGERRDNNGSTIANVQYRLRRPDGNIVMGPASLPTSGAGWINTYDQATIGSKQPFRKLRRLYPIDTYSHYGWGLLS